MSAETKTSAQIMTRVITIGAVVDGSLGVYKIVIGLTNQSHAQVADGVHSLSDLNTDVLVILAAKYSLMQTFLTDTTGFTRLRHLFLRRILLAKGIYENYTIRFLEHAIIFDLRVFRFSATLFIAQFRTKITTTFFWEVRPELT
ncbi:MAG TPA: hypothetical protein DEF72_03010 [Gammaproteobacteria bacterium]|nr:hypothetical protein [Gammaproteobacteria bacterium]HBX26383.1 hypothetical protein [Gammaproteobacteria bacterium]